MNNEGDDEEQLPYVQIVEEPASRLLRFRYECEARFAENIQGVNTSLRMKTFPAIQIKNYTGPVFIVVSCVTKDEPYRPHPHKLVGRSTDAAQGICYFRIPANQKVITFSNLGIQCVRKVDIAKSLTERERQRIDPFRTGFSHKHSSEDSDEIDMSCVRLCFQAFIEKTPNQFDLPLKPVVTNPIYDKKSASELSVWRISHCSAPATGGTEICILGEKIPKNDIEVLFYCKKTDWEAKAEFVAPKFYKQIAVIFKCPQYVDLDITKPAPVIIQLSRPSDGEISKPIDFEYTPINQSSSIEMEAKRLRLNNLSRSLIEKKLQAESSSDEQMTNSDV